MARPPRTAAAQLDDASRASVRRRREATRLTVPAALPGRGGLDDRARGDAETLAALGTHRTVQPMTDPRPTYASPTLAALLTRWLGGSPRSTDESPVEFRRLDPETGERP